MLRNTYTSDDLIERLNLMRIFYSKRLFAGGDDLSLPAVLRGSCSPETLEALLTWQQSFEEGGVSELVVYEALDAIEEDVAGVPSVILYVPVRFSAQYVEHFGKWFRENVQPNILITLRTDPHMGGGCGLIWKDTYYDLSLRYHIQHHRKELVAMFNKHAHAQ